MTSEKSDNNQNINEITDDINSLPESERDQLLVQLNTQVNNYGGMLPNPETLEKYNNMVPGSAEKYFNEVFEESKFRRSLIDKQQNSDNSYRIIGMILGAIFGIIMVIGSFYLILNDHPVAGGVIGGSLLLGVLSIFINPENKDKEWIILI